MAKLDFYYNNVKVNEDIKNWRDLEIELNFEDDARIGIVRTGTFDFTGALANNINTWNTAGLFGGAGILEAPPFRIEVCGAGNILFDGGVNTAACDTLYQCDEVNAELREADRMDFLNDRANSFSFAFLADLPASAPGHISQSDYVLVPYVINSIPDGIEIITGIISLFVLVKELEQAIEKTTGVIIELVGDIFPTVGSGATIAVGAIFADILKLLLYLVYLAILTVAIIDLSQLVFESLIQPVKYKKGIKVYTLLKRATEYLGMQFSSSLFQPGGQYEHLTIIPKKTALATNITSQFSFVSSVTGLVFKMKRYDDAQHPSTYGYFEGTFGDLLLALNDVFNSKATIVKQANGFLIFYYERIDHFQNQSTYVLPNLVKYDPHGTNACEWDANYYITYALDASETNTYDLYEGTNIQHILSPIIINKRGNVLLKGITEKRLGFTRAKDKKSNNAIEDIFNVIYIVAQTTYNIFSFFVNVTVATAVMPLLIPVNIIFSLFNVPPITPPQLPPFPPNPIGNRIGMMLLSSDFIGVPKLLIVAPTSNTVATTNEVLTSADYLMDNFHFLNFAIRLIDSAGNQHNDHNQWITYKDKDVPLCCSDYIKIKNNRFVKTFDGKIARIDSLVWNPYKEKARISFRVKELITKNLKETYLITKN